MTASAIDDVVRRVLSGPAPIEPRIVGIDGPSGSGKSTLARRLVERLPDAGLVEIDDFVSWSDFGGWWPRFVEQVLDPLRAGDDAHYQVRDWANDEFGTSLAAWKTLPRTPLVIVEGVTCTRRAARDYLACSIWIDAPRMLRLARGVERDGEDHRDLWVRWMDQEQAFFTSDDTRRRADLRLPGDFAQARTPDQNSPTDSS